MYFIVHQQEAISARIRSACVGSTVVAAADERTAWSALGVSPGFGLAVLYYAFPVVAENHHFQSVSICGTITIRLPTTYKF